MLDRTNAAMVDRHLTRRVEHTTATVNGAPLEGRLTGVTGTAAPSPFDTPQGWHSPYRDAGPWVEVEWDDPAWGVDRHPAADVRVLDDAEAGAA